MKGLCSISILISLISWTACTGPSRVYTEPVYAPIRPQPTPTITESLFDSKERTISEENIKKLLDGQLTIPDNVRIAIFKYKSNSQTSYSKVYGFTDDEEVLKTQQSYIDTLINGLERTPRIQKINLIPSMMHSTRPNITELRETAVRLQSDMLLVFAITSDIYYKFKFLKKDEAKAFATTEVFLMDVRTGLVPFSTIVTKDFLAQNISSEIIDETRKKAEQQAVRLTLAEINNRMFLYFKNLK